MITFEQAEMRADILKAMAHPVRLMIVDLLTIKDTGFSEINKIFSYDKSTTSKHLTILRKAGIISTVKSGNESIFHLEVACVNGFFACSNAVIQHNIKKMSCCTSEEQEKKGAKMIIKVLGTGCTKCKKLEANVIKAIADSGIDAEIIKVEELDKIIAYGIMITPGLVINEEIVSAGKLLTVKEIVTIIKEY